MAGLKRNITICGGGLAGLSLGIALRRRGVPVTIHEAGDYPRHRVCGEFISGVSRETLDGLGIADLFADARAHHSLVWHDARREIFRGRLPEAALGISRHALDARLADRFHSLGGVLETRSRMRPEPSPGLVWAAGRRPCRGEWIGLKAHYTSLPMAADLEMHLGDHGYVGLAGIECGRVNVCGLFRVDSRLRGADLLASYLAAGGLGGLGARLLAADCLEESRCAIAGFALGRQAEIPGLPTLGDAESIIPPFTGNGMSMAFQAAHVCSALLADWACGDGSWETVTAAIRQALGRKFRTRLAASAVLHPALLHRPGRKVMSGLAAAGLLPFRTALASLR